MACLFLQRDRSNRTLSAGQAVSNIEFLSDRDLIPIKQSVHQAMEVLGRIFPALRRRTLPKLRNPGYHHYGHDRDPGLKDEA